MNSHILFFSIFNTVSRVVKSTESCVQVLILFDQYINLLVLNIIFNSAYLTFFYMEMHFFKIKVENRSNARSSQLSFHVTENVFIIMRELK